jgi:hypothetical protein
VQKDKVTILVIVLVVGAGIFGALQYLDYKQRAAMAEVDGVYVPGNEPEHSDLTGDGRVSAETFDARDTNVIKCYDEKVGTFYTNADNCEEADLDQPDTRPPPRDPDES